jgi:hypothetical protein
VGPVRTDVAAFWPAESQDLARLGDPNISFVVLEQTWPTQAAADAAWRDKARALLEDLAPVVLGYVFSRDGGTNASHLVPDDISAAVQAWYEQFAGCIDGVYFDNAVLPPDADDVAMYPMPGGAAATAKEYWSGYLPGFRDDPAHATRSGRGATRAMLLAGQSPNEWVVQVADFALMCELNADTYFTAFAAYRPNENI